MIVDTKLEIRLLIPPTGVPSRVNQNKDIKGMSGVIDKEGRGQAPYWLDHLLLINHDQL